MAAEFFCDRQVLAKWMVGGQACYLLRGLEGEGPRAVVDTFGGKLPLAFVKAVEMETVVEIDAPHLVTGLVELRAALQAARRVIETGKEERHAWRTAIARQGVEVVGLEDSSASYAQALAGFESEYGSRYPITEDLRRNER